VLDLNVWYSVSGLFSTKTEAENLPKIMMRVLCETLIV
jgi:hypothetical protein